MMSKREIIFLSAVGVAAAVFLIDRLLPDTSGNSEQTNAQIAEAQSFVDKQVVRIKTMALQPHEKVALDFLLNELPANPFAREFSGAISNQKEFNSMSSITPALSYNGYLRAKNRIIALVNDEDYEVGNQIKDTPLVICAISKETINLENSKFKSKSKLNIKIQPPDSETGDL